VEALVASYFNLLNAEVHGERPIKAEANRVLQSRLPARSRGSIEYKLRNVSAVLNVRPVLDDEHLPFIDGYKPATNFQGDLVQAVLDWVRGNRSIAEELASYGSAPPPASLPPSRLRDVVVERPTGTARRGPRGGLYLSQGAWGAFRDSQLRSLGEAGKRWVANLQRIELEAVGRADLAGRVEWTSKDRGDGFGYDISSFDPDGSPIQIEVKTTNLGPRSPFYVTRNELAKSEELADSYRLYRVFDFAREARLFIVPGSVAQGFAIEPLDYIARVS
jgi:hypothetical protein